MASVNCAHVSDSFQKRTPLETFGGMGGRVKIVFGNGVLMWAAMTQSVERLATCWTVRDSNPCRGEIFRTRPDRRWGPRNLLYNGYRVPFPGVKRPGRGVDHPPHLAPTL